MIMEYVLLFLLTLPLVALEATHNRRSRGAAPIDLGFVFAGIVFVYAWLPLLGLILAQHGYGELQDQRVENDFPTPTEIVIVGASYLAFLAGFALFYRGRRRVIPTSLVLVSSNRHQVLISLAIVCLLITMNFLGERLLGVGGSESYIDSYTRLRHLPLEVQQIMGGLGQLIFAASLAAMVFVIAWKPSLHRYVALVIFVLLLDVTLFGGSRTFGFLLAFAYVICISIYVQKLKSGHLFLIGALGLALFILAGAFRANNELDALMLSPFQDGEFVSIFINSIDLIQRNAEDQGLDIPWQLSWVDLLRFIPQQFLGVDKIDPATWYVTNYYSKFSEMGGGLAFGAIAESVVGFGITEAFIRGGLLGVAYAFVANRCISDHLTPLKVFIYVWFVVMSYQAIRDTTFSVFPRFVFSVLPVIFLLSVAYSLMRVVFRRGSIVMSIRLKSGL